VRKRGSPVPRLPPEARRSGGFQARRARDRAGARYAQTKYCASFVPAVRSTEQSQEVIPMPTAYLEPTPAGGEGIETTPAVAPEQELLPAATIRLVPYAIDEVEWQQVDEYPLAY
jgi:hypothetical protein